MRDFEYSSLNRMSLSKTFAQGSGIYVKEEMERLQDAEVDDSKEHCLLDTGGCFHVRMNTDCDGIYKTCTSSIQTKFRHGEGKVGTKLYP